MTDVVKTTILSHQWEKLWINTPCLTFEECKKEMDIDRVRNFINRTLIFWKKTRLQKFNLDFGTHLKKPLYNDIDYWVRFAIQYEVEELYVKLEYDVLPSDGAGAIEATREKLYWACVYSCSSLKMLCLKGCNLHIPIKNVNWNQLKYLTIDGFGLSQDLINKILSGSPNLEVFILYIMENHDNLSIQSSSLKQVFINKYLYYEGGDDPCLDTELRISTPDLELLDIGGVPYSKCLMTVSTIQHVERVVLSDWCIKALGVMNEEYAHSLYLNAVFLELKECSQDYEQIVDLLEMFPKLRNLVIETTHRTLPKHAESCLKVDRNLPYSFMLQLRTVSVNWTMGGNSMLPLIQILLKCASKLEKMVLREKQIEQRTSWKSLFMQSQKLLSMPRSSPTAELIFCVL